jgi:hypothetical protein
VSRGIESRHKESMAFMGVSVSSNSKSMAMIVMFSFLSWVSLGFLVSARDIYYIIRSPDAQGAPGASE